MCAKQLQPIWFSCYDVLLHMDEKLLIEAYKADARGEGLDAPSLRLLLNRLEKVDNLNKLLLLDVGSKHDALGIMHIRHALTRIMADKFIESLD